MNRNILLYAGETSDTSFLPIGLLYIASSLRMHGYNPIILKKVESITNFKILLSTYDPIFIGFSVFTSSHIKRIITLSTIAKDMGFIVVWGGHHPTVLADECIKEIYIDFVVKGEGEAAVIDLCNYITNPDNNNNNMIFESKIDIDINKYEPALDLVDLKKYVSTPQNSIQNNYSNLLSFGYLLTSRGCPFNCNFCSVNSLFFKEHKYKSISSNNIIKQIDYIKYKLPQVNSIIIWDDCFFEKTTPTFREIEILSFLKDKGIQFNIEVRAAFLTNYENVKFLVSMGCLQVYVGAESGSQRVLNLMNKKATIKTYNKAIENCIKQNLPIRLSFFYGYPYETFNDISKTKAYISRVSKMSSLISISGPKLYRPTPGTRAYIKALELGFVNPKSTKEWSNISSSNLNQLPWLINECTTNGIPYENILNFLNIRM
jgi:anaerobic magnesium-protoporphyrin IX monomethyl ester cyclase